MTFSGSFNAAQIPSQEELEPQQEPETDKEAPVEELISSLVSLSSYVHQLYIQSHLIHLNIEGPLFLPIHEFLKEQYDAHIGQFDAIAEFVRSMDFLMPMCQRGLLTAYKGFKHVKSYEARESLTTYLKNLETCGFMAKDAGTLAKRVQAPDVENYMADLVGASFKASWFLKSTLRG